MYDIEEAKKESNNLEEILIKLILFLLLLEFLQEVENIEDVEEKVD